jgi:hypothetical protein
MSADKGKFNLIFRGMGIRARLSLAFGLVLWFGGEFCIFVG